RQEELRATGIALTAGTAAKLVVDTTRFMALGCKDVETAGGERLLLQPLHVLADCLFLCVALRSGGHISQFLGNAHVGVAAELDVGTTTSHVRGDGDRAWPASLRDDRGFLLMVARIEHLEFGKALCLQARCQLLGLL